MTQPLDDDARYRAVSAKDARFDGQFVVAVTSTKIYCRPSCPARTPMRRNVRFLPGAAAAQREGFRACKRCRPDASPGSPQWDVRADLVARAMRLVRDGLVDREGVSGLAERLGYSARHLTREVTAELGAGPTALARARRAQNARILLEASALPITDVAFAAGFSSVRQFNATIQEVFDRTPTQLRERVRGSAARLLRPGSAAGSPVVEFAMRLAVREPFDAAGLHAFLAARAVKGVEASGPDWYRRTLRLPHGVGTVELDLSGTVPRCVPARLRLTDVRDLPAAVARCRALLDLDADPQAIDHALGAHPLLAPLVEAVPGRRIAGCVDPLELAVRTVIGQQVSVAGARTLLGRLVEHRGTPLPAGVDPDLTHLFPDPAELAEHPLAGIGLTTARAGTVQALCAAVESGELALDVGADRDRADRQLQALPGVGPWTAAVLRMRALRDPDVFLSTDLAVRRSLRALGQPDQPAVADRLAESWRPWRSYALVHLWAAPAPLATGRTAA